jgi:hypothetical protein
VLRPEASLVSSQQEQPVQRRVFWLSVLLAAWSAAWLTARLTSAG